MTWSIEYNVFVLFSIQYMSEKPWLIMFYTVCRLPGVAVVRILSLSDNISNSWPWSVCADHSEVVSTVLSHRHIGWKIKINQAGLWVAITSWKQFNAGLGWKWICRKPPKEVWWSAFNFSYHIISDCSLSPMLSPYFSLHTFVVDWNIKYNRTEKKLRYRWKHFGFLRWA